MGERERGKGRGRTGACRLSRNTTGDGIRGGRGEEEEKSGDERGQGQIDRRGRDRG